MTASQAAPGGESVGLAEPPPRPTSWYAATVAEDEKGSFLMVHFWSKGPLLRSEAVIAGRRIVTIVNGDTYYILDAVGGTGVAIGRSEVAIVQDKGRERPFGNELRDILVQGGELIRSETAGGREVDVYRVTNGRGRRTLWISHTDPQVPLRVETFDRASATTGRIDYVNWLHRPLLPDGFFEPDPRIELERVTYEQYGQRVGRRLIGPAPVLYRHLLHGK